MKCQKCNGNMEINRIRTHLVWVDELDHVPDPGTASGTYHCLCMQGLRLY